MRLAVRVLVAFSFLFSVSVWASEAHGDGDLCSFRLTSTEPARPEVLGPPDLVSRVHVLAQPDSPIEITGIDLSDTLISVHRGIYTKHLEVQMKFRNRTDRRLAGVEAWVRLGFLPQGIGSGSGRELTFPRGLAPGQETEYLRVAGGGYGTGPAPHENYFVVAMIESADVQKCRYFPSRHVPVEPRFRRAVRPTVGTFMPAGFTLGTTEQCSFELRETKSAEPLVAGPEDVTQYVSFVTHPGSPLEILEIDFEGYDLIIGGQEYRHRPKCRINVRNRSDQAVKNFSLWVGSGGRGLPDTFNGALTPGEETGLFQLCGGYGGGAFPPHASYQIPVEIEYVDFEDCRYYPGRAETNAVKHLSAR